MKTTLAIATCAWVVYAIPSLALSQPVLVQPKKSGLVTESVDSKQFVASFTGSTWVKGTVVATWPNGTYEKTEQNADIVLVPTPSAAKAIPYFSGYPVTYIALDNGFQALISAVGNKLANRFMSGEVQTVKAMGSFQIEHLVVSVECDAAWARASLSESITSRHVLLASAGVTYGC